MRAQNQDGYLIRRWDNGLLAAVADGIGGAPAGAEASRLALAAVEERTRLPRRITSRTIQAAMEEAHRRVRAAARGDAALSGMGTTLSVAYCRPGRCVVGHVGDSRVYRFTDGAVAVVTQDHSVAGEMTAVGTLSAAEARVHPQRHVLTRAIGPFDSVTVDRAVVPFRPGDRILLCSDGLVAVAEDGEIGHILATVAGAAAADALVDLALARGGPDNITVVVVDWVADPHADGVGRS